MLSTIKKGPRTHALKKRLDPDARLKALFSAMQSAQIYVQPVGDEIMRSAGLAPNAATLNQQMSRALFALSEVQVIRDPVAPATNPSRFRQLVEVIEKKILAWRKTWL